MDNKLLAIGSVIDLGGKTLSVIGYTVGETKDGKKPGYVLVPYPFGFVSFDKFLFMPADASATVLFEGYTDKEGEAYNGLLASMLPDLAGADPEKLRELTEKIRAAKEDKQ